MPPKVKKTRNNGQWSEARFKSFIKSLLRKGTMRWGPVNTTKKAAWVERGKYLCAECKQVVPLKKDGKKNVFVDHKISATDSVEGFTTWDDFIEGLFCEEENLQVLCKNCHDIKSKEEAELKRKHADWPSLTPEYNSWRSMRARCLFKSHEAYKNYGGRGIKICDRWVNSFDNFLEDMGPRPEGKTLDRIDVNKGYYKENCKWSNPLEQSNNRRNNVFLDFDGESKTISQWSRDLQIPTSTIINRLSRGYNPEKALDKNFKRGTKKPKYSDEDFVRIVSECKTFEEVSSKTNYCFDHCRKRAKKLGANLSGGCHTRKTKEERERRK